MLKGVYNIKTKVFKVTGEEIEPLETIALDEDHWDSVISKETGEPLYDINIFFDDFAEDGGDENNPKNYQAQFVNLEKNGEGLTTTGHNYQTLPLEVIAK